MNCQPASKVAKMAELITITNYIDGEFVPARNHLDSFDPSVGEVWARIPDSSEEEVNLAVTAAKRAFQQWSKTSPAERSKVMLWIADLVEEHFDEMAELESRDQGKPVWLAKRVDIPRLIHNFRFFASSILYTRNHSTILHTEGFNYATNYTMTMPIGVAGLISPWNLPLYLLSFKIAPCIAAGNTCVCKPSEMTSVSAWRLAALMNEAVVTGQTSLKYSHLSRYQCVVANFLKRTHYCGQTHIEMRYIDSASPSAGFEAFAQESDEVPNEPPSPSAALKSFVSAESDAMSSSAGLPKGVVNMVFGVGSGAGAVLVQHPDVPLVSFTGGTETGARIMQLASPLCKKISLELGGKNAALVFDDCDLDEIMPTVVRSGFTNQGEICLCMSRVFVQATIFDQFVEKYVAAARKMTVGPPKEDSSKLGALISQAHLEKVRSYVKLAKIEGGTVHCGEGVDRLSLPDTHRKGYYMAPTVVTGLPTTSRCMQEEIFGPMVCIAPFQSEEEAVQKANGVRFGLAACVWSQDAGRVHRISQQLEAGTVWINCWIVRDLNMPFGGFKASGLGREGVNESMEFYQETKCVCIVPGH